MNRGTAYGPLLVTGGLWSRPEVAEQIDQFELPVSDEDLPDWVRQGREAAAVMSNRENLPESIYKPESGFDREGHTLLQQDFFLRSAFLRIVGKHTHVQVVASNPLPDTGLVDAHMESLHALPLDEEHDESVSWLGNSRLEPRLWAGMLWMWSRVSPFKCSVFMWK